MTHILYIEDDMMNQRVVEMMLTSVLNYPEPLIWSDTASLEARLKALTTQVDVVLLDIDIGPLDGLEALPILRAHLPQARIVACTASLDSNQYLRVRRAGFDGLLAKPLNIDTFESDLVAILDGQQIWQDC